MKQKIKENNRITLLIALELEISQSAVVKRIERGGKGFEKLLNDTRIIKILKKEKLL